jgi:nucleoside-diphosphate-sugar epimerase
MANNQKIKKIGWTPKTELKQGLKITLDWYATKS